MFLQFFSALTIVSDGRLKKCQKSSKFQCVWVNKSLNVVVSLGIILFKAMEK